VLHFMGLSKYSLHIGLFGVAFVIFCVYLVAQRILSAVRYNNDLNLQFNYIFTAVVNLSYKILLLLKSSYKSLIFELYFRHLLWPTKIKSLVLSIFTKSARHFLVYTVGLI